MEQKKNTPPKGVLVAVAVIVLLIVFYFVLGAIFPGIFHNLNTGEAAPLQNN